MPLEFVERESLGGTEGLSRVLSLGLIGDTGLILIVILGLGSLRGFGGSGSSDLGGSGLLLGGSVDDAFLDQSGGSSEDGGEVGLVDNGVEVTEDVGVGGTELSVENLHM